VKRLALIIISMTIYSPELLEMVVRILCDVRSKRPAAGAFLFGQTIDNQASVLSAARHVIDNRIADKILFIQSDAMSGYPGYVAWHTALCQMGVTPASIAGVELKKTASLNTFQR